MSGDPSRYDDRYHATSRDGPDRPWEGGFYEHRDCGFDGGTTWKGDMVKTLGVPLIIPVLLVLAGFVGCSKQNGSPTDTSSPSGTQQRTTTKSKEKALVPEQNPTGDIPDTQAFIRYESSQGGYALEAPEGWARTTNGAEVTFINKLDGISTTVTGSSITPSAKTVGTNQAEALKKTGRAVTIKSIQDLTLANGHAVLVTYESNSEPDPVTNKQVRLENETYIFHKDGKLVELRLWAPVGADNADQWKRISNSFRWR